MIMMTSEKDLTRMLYSLIHNEEYAEAIVILKVSINIELNDQNGARNPRRSSSAYAFSIMKILSIKKKRRNKWNSSPDLGQRYLYSHTVFIRCNLLVRLPARMIG
jgi:hypothetical protein